MADSTERKESARVSSCGCPKAAIDWDCFIRTSSTLSLSGSPLHSCSMALVSATSCSLALLSSAPQGGAAGAEGEVAAGGAEELKGGHLHTHSTANEHKTRWHSG